MPKLSRLPIFHCSRFTVHVSFLIILPCLIAWGTHRTIEEGNEYYAKGQYDKAIAKYRQAGDSPIAYYNLGNTFYRKKNYKKAIEQYRRVLVAEDKSLREKAYYNMGNAQFKLGILRAAISSYQNALRLNPNDYDAKYNLEYVLRELKRRIQKSFSKSSDKRISKKNQKQFAGGKEKQEETDSFPKSKTSEEEVKRVLNAIRKEEKELQKKLLYRKLLNTQNTAIEKDW